MKCNLCLSWLNIQASFTETKFKKSTMFSNSTDQSWRLIKDVTENVRCY